MTLLTEIPFLEDFATAGEGNVDADMDAFAAASAWLEAEGGGSIQFRQGRTYWVGRQTLAGAGGGTFSYSPDPVLRVREATRPIVIQGNGARFKAVPGLRYGTFDPVTGAPTSHALPFSGSEAASPYIGMIELLECTGGFIVRDIELDGSNEDLVLGGLYGDVGRQIPASGLHLIDNKGPVLIENVHSHHHGWDGALFRHVATQSGDDDAFSAPINFIGYVAEYNARQGLSLTGGRGITIVGSKFNRSGRAINGGVPLATGPGAGCDIEAEGGQINRDIHFINCEFADNFGIGLVADTGDSADIGFQRCRFIGTTEIALWPNKPRMRFEDCLVAGMTVAAYHSPNWRDAVRFVRTRFSYDLSLSPTGAIRGSGAGSSGVNYLMDLGASGRRVVFDDCDIEGSTPSPAFWSAAAVPRIVNSRISDGSGLGTIASGVYSGACTIDSPALNAAAAVVRDGRLTLNGVVQRLASASWAPGSIAAGATATTTLTIPMAAVGDSVVAALDPSPAGFELNAAITAAGTMTARLTNRNAGAVNPGSMTLHGRLLDS